MESIQTDQNEASILGAETVLQSAQPLHRQFSASPASIRPGRQYAAAAALIAWLCRCRWHLPRTRRTRRRTNLISRDISPMGAVAQPLPSCLSVAKTWLATNPGRHEGRTYANFVCVRPPANLKGVLTRLCCAKLFAGFAGMAVQVPSHPLSHWPSTAPGRPAPLESHRPRPHRERQSEHAHARRAASQQDQSTP